MKRDMKERIQLWRPFEESFGAQKEIISISFDKDYCWFSEFWVDHNYKVKGQGNTHLIIDRTDPNYNAPEKMEAFRN